MTTGFGSNDSHWDIDPARIDRNWRAIVFELDAPRPGRIERLLRFVGLPPHLTRLMVSTPALRRAWYVAIGLAFVVAVGPYDDTQSRDNLFGLLLIAPLVPVLGVSFAYGIEADPAHEASAATPMRGLRLVLTRASVVLGVSVVLLSSAALLAPGAPALAFAWLLPSLGLTLATVALMTVVAPRRAAMFTTIVWVVAVFMARGATSDRLAAFTLTGQVVMALLAGLAMALIWFRRDRFDQLEVGL